MVLITYNDQHCHFTSIFEIRSCSLLQKVTYHTHIFHWDARWKSTRDAGWKQFPPSIKPLFYAFKTHLFLHFKGCGFTTGLFMDFPQYRLTLKHPNSIHHLLTAGSNSLFIAYDHAGCWVEFHPAPLSEGCVLNIFLWSLHLATW